MSSLLSVVEGQVLTSSVEFLDDDDDSVLRPQAGYPVVKLQNQNKATIAQAVASPVLNSPGTWSVSFSVPVMGIEGQVEFRLLWKFKSESGDLYKHSETVVIEPKAEVRDTDVVISTDDTEFTFRLPVALQPTATASYQIYDKNVSLIAGDERLLRAENTAVDIQRKRTSAVITCPAPKLEPALLSRMLSVSVKNSGGTKKEYIYKLWCVTPQIKLGANSLESFLNKARVDNIIPELDYTMGDLVHYLERGLYLFNMMGQPTDFTGTNMQGPLFDAWLTCSSYYALSAQILAEGSLAFNFSGQGVSLEVDRTPQLESALGRIETAMNDRIVALKKILQRNGITGGDGSQGLGLHSASTTLGVLSLTNAPTTRLPRFSGMYVGRRN